MATVASGELVITTYDAAGKHSNQRVASAVQSNLNILAQQTAADALLSATAALSNGFQGRNSLGNVYVTTPFALPSSAAASVGTKLAVTYSDNVTGRKYTTQIAVADYTVGVYNGTDDLVISSAGPGQTYKNAFEAFVLSDAGNAVTVQRIRKVSRHFMP